MLGGIKNSYKMRLKVFVEYGTYGKRKKKYYAWIYFIASILLLRKYLHILRIKWYY